MVFSCNKSNYGILDVNIIKALQLQVLLCNHLEQAFSCDLISRDLILMYDIIAEGWRNNR